jgi:hypothetical protein
MNDNLPGANESEKSKPQFPLATFRVTLLSAAIHWNSPNLSRLVESPQAVCCPSRKPLSSRWLIV